uniref:hypothetical protein n=1 Tax=Flavobacterium sp. TaxID=239 RepID=UPI00404A870B
MKRVIFLFVTLLLVLNSCQNGGIEQLRRDVLKSIEEKIQSEGGGIDVVSFTLTHVNGNEYVGVVETMENGTAYTYPVNVIFDGKTFVWEIPPTEASDAIDNYEYPDEAQIEEEYSNHSTNPSSDENRSNMMEALENGTDPTYCSLCQGTGIEKNTAKEIFGGPDGRICPMCDGKGRRTY